MGQPEDDVRWRRPWKMKSNTMSVFEQLGYHDQLNCKYNGEVRS